MGDRSAIAWTDTTWNPVAGCTRVSAGCDNCYAAALSAGRLKNTPTYSGLAVLTPGGRAAFNGKIRLLPDRVRDPERWRKPRRVFVNSMSDLFHEGIPDDYVRRVFSVMALATRHQFQVLTKRPERMAHLVPQFAKSHTAPDGSGWPLRNVWLGVSVEDQKTADERIPFLLNTPAAVRFISAEPLLGAVDLIRLGPMDDGQGGHMAPDALAGGWWHKRGRAQRWYRMESGPALDWVIVGAESGPNRREMDLSWLISIVDQCLAARVPVFTKQDSAFTPGQQGRIPDEYWLKQFPEVSHA